MNDTVIKDILTRLDQLEEKNKQNTRINRKDIIPKEIKQTHIDGIILFRGLLADRPETGSTEIQLYLATDTNTIYFWNSVDEEWKSIATQQSSQVIKFGDSSNYLQIGTDGSLTLVGNATVFQDLETAISSIRLPATNPPTVASYKGSQVLSFSNTVDNFIYFDLQLPYGYKTGSDITLHLHRVLPVAGSGVGAENVKWIATHSWANIDAAFPTETSVNVTNDVQDESADINVVDDIVTISGTGKTPGSMVLFSLQRDTSVANNYANAVYLVEVDVNCELESLGEN